MNVGLSGSCAVGSNTVASRPMIDGRALASARLKRLLRTCRPRTHPSVGSAESSDSGSDRTGMASRAEPFDRADLHLDENLGAAAITFTDAELSEFRTALESTPTPSLCATTSGSCSRVTTSPTPLSARRTPLHEPAARSGESGQNHHVQAAPRPPGVLVKSVAGAGVSYSRGLSHTSDRLHRPPSFDWGR